MGVHGGITNNATDVEIGCFMSANDPVPMNEVLRTKGLLEVAEDKICVTDLKGPLEDGWREKVADSADLIGAAMLSLGARTS